MATAAQVLLASYPPAEAHIVWQVYMDLKEVKKWHEVEIKENKTLGMCYLMGRKDSPRSRLHPTVSDCNLVHDTEREEKEEEDEEEEEKEDSLEIVVPMATHKPMTISRMTLISRELASETDSKSMHGKKKCRWTMALVDGDSTLVYYSLCSDWLPAQANG